MVDRTVVAEPGGVRYDTARFLMHLARQSLSGTDSRIVCWCGAAG